MSKALTTEELKRFEDMVSRIQRFGQKLFFGFPRTHRRAMLSVHKEEVNMNRRSYP